MQFLSGDHSNWVDLPVHRGKRKRLIQVLREKGIQDELVLAVMEKLPRHFFIDATLEEQAYQDKAVPIGSKQTISQPYTVARQTELLQLKPDLKVLEIGTGSGYQAAVLLGLGVELYSIERITDLHNATLRLFRFLGLATQGLILGDGSLGLPLKAPFDRILVTAGAPSIPEALFEQLKVGGCMVIPVGDSRNQEMVRCYKSPTGNPLIEKHGNYSFVPLKGKQGWH